MTAPRDWKPTAPIETLRLRASLLARVRAFFAERGVLEVETPALGSATVTDPHIESIRAVLGGQTCFLQTSPEFSMKRLLAWGSGPIYQIAKAYRDGESGERHNPEFTLLEWYRPGHDHHALMDEVELLLQEVLGTPRARRQSYKAIYQQYLGLNPHRVQTSELRARGRELGLSVAVADELSQEDWLNLLMALEIEPKLGLDAPLFVFDYPVELAALARIRDGDPPVAERFEVYLRGMELANGYHELTSAATQRERFLADRMARERMGRPPVVEDERLLAALEHGLPSSAGVALGFDRLVMIAAHATNIRSVLSFPIDRA